VNPRAVACNPRCLIQILGRALGFGSGPNTRSAFASRVRASGSGRLPPVADQVGSNRRNPHLGTPDPPGMVSRAVPSSRRRPVGRWPWIPPDWTTAPGRHLAPLHARWPSPTPSSPGSTVRPAAQSPSHRFPPWAPLGGPQAMPSRPPAERTHLDLGAPRLGATIVGGGGCVWVSSGLPPPTLADSRPPMGPVGPPPDGTRSALGWDPFRDRQSTSRWCDAPARKPSGISIRLRHVGVRIRISPGGDMDHLGLPHGGGICGHRHGGHLIRYRGSGVAASQQNDDETTLQVNRGRRTRLTTFRALPIGRCLQRSVWPAGLLSHYSTVSWNPLRPNAGYGTTPWHPTNGCLVQVPGRARPEFPV